MTRLILYFGLPAAIVNYILISVFWQGGELPRRTEAQTPDYVVNALAAAVQITGYDHPGFYPEVVYLTPEDMEKRACPSAPNLCGRIAGLYTHRHIVYMNEKTHTVWQETHDYVLFHELVHFLQHTNRSRLEYCDREREAYAAEDVYRVEYRGSAPRSLKPACHPTKHYAP